MIFKDDLILVTGGAGAIGCSLVQRLSQEGAKIIVLDDFSSGYEDNIAGIDNVQLIKSTIADENVLAKVFIQPITYLFHLAASFANQKSIEHPLADLDTNVVGTLRLLQHSMSLKELRKFVHVSSSCVYGHTDGVINEETPVAPDTPYAISKLASENYARFFGRYYALPVVILRYFNCYGPGEHPGEYRNVIPNFFKLAMEGKPLPITGTGEETRTFTFVSDVIDGTIKSALKEGAIGECFNISSDNEIDIKDLAEKINVLTGNKARMNFVKMRDWDMTRRRFASYDKAKNILDYKPVVNLDEGLKHTYKWLLDLQKQGKL